MMDSIAFVVHGCAWYHTILWMLSSVSWRFGCLPICLCYDGSLWEGQWLQVLPEVTAGSDCKDKLGSGFNLIIAWWGCWLTVEGRVIKSEWSVAGNLFHSQNHADQVAVRWHGGWKFRTALRERLWREELIGHKMFGNNSGLWTIVAVLLVMSGSEDPRVLNPMNTFRVGGWEGHAFPGV